MKRLLLFLSILLILSVSTASAQCPGGQCPLRKAPKAAAKVAVKVTEKAVVVATKPVKLVVAVHQGRKTARRARRGC